MKIKEKEGTSYDYLSLVMKLSELHNFYFDPNSRDKHEGNSEDQAKKDKDKEEFWELVQSHKNSLQLNSPHYEYLIPANKDDWGRNPYFRLYSFLQDENDWFVKFQTQEAKILWCLFAYVDATSHTEPVKYLFGPSKGESEKDLNPHFLFRTFHKNVTRGTFESVKSEVIDNIAKAAYYARKKATKYSDVDFVYVLQSYRKRTDFEFDNDLMYIPSGEMDCCILQWLLLILKDGGAQHSINDKMYFDVSKVKDEILDEEHTSFIKIPYEGSKEPKKILEWLQIWGLIKVEELNDSIEQSQFKVLPRGISMLHWLCAYLKSLNCNRNKETAPKVFYDDPEPDFWRVLGLRNAMLYDRNDSYYYLKNIFRNKQDEIIDTFETRNNIDDDTAKKQFINLLELMFEWDEKNSEGSDKVWQTFHKRCRFSTFIHYLVRFGENDKPNTEVSNAPSGLLAFPILWDTIIMKEKQERQPVGIFMSVILENNDENQSCFRDYGIPTVKKEFHERITKIRTVINQLAKVENIEVYQRGIRAHQEEERAKQESLAAIAGSTHFFKSWVNIMLRSKLPDDYKDDIDEVMNIPEMVNLISKVFREPNELEKEKILNASTLLRTREQFTLNEIVDEFQNITIDNRRISFSINKDRVIATNSCLAYVFQKRFYRLLFATIAENAVSNMPGSLNALNIEIIPILDASGRLCELKFKNQANRSAVIPTELLDKTPKTGGLFYFHFFLSVANKGAIECWPEESGGIRWFITILKINELNLL